MYTLEECLIAAGLVLIVGAGTFFAFAMVVLVEAGVRVGAKMLRKFASHAITEIVEKWETPALPQPASQGEQKC